MFIGSEAGIAFQDESKGKATAIARQGQKGVQISAHLFPPGKTRDELAKIAGVSHNTIDKVKQIVEYGTPEQVTRIKAGGKGDSINAVFREVCAAKAPESPEPENVDTGAGTGAM